MSVSWIQWKYEKKFGTWYQHLWWTLRHGKWDATFESRTTWKDKPYFLIFRFYHDGMHAGIHLWRFYLGVWY